MIKKVIFTADLYRPNSLQQDNLDKLFYLLSPCFTSVKDIECIRDSGEFLLEFDTWAESLDGDSSSRFANYDLEHALIIGFELNPSDLQFFNAQSISWINIAIHPLRFLDDLYLTIESSKFDFGRYAVSNDVIKFLANRIKLSNLHGSNDLKENSLIVIGQEPFDTSIRFNGEFRYISDYMDLLKDLSARYDHVYFRPHPFKSDEVKNQAILQALNAELMVGSDYYSVVSSDKIAAVAGISSSAIHEAEFFDKHTYFLQEKRKYISPPIPFLSLMHSVAEWGSEFLGRPQSVFPKYARWPYKENMLRDYFGSWTYETEFMKVNNHIGSLLSENHVRAQGIENLSLQTDNLSQRIDQLYHEMVDHHELLKCYGSVLRPLLWFRRQMIKILGK